MAWIEGTATDYRDMLDQLIECVTSDHVDTVAIVAGGTGHAVDDIITITDGTSTHAASFRVTSVAAGVIDGIQIEQGGAYTVDPDLTATTAWTTSGSGVGATFDLTMNSEPWTVERRAQEAVSATVAAGGTGYSVSDQITLTMDGGGVQGATGEGTQYGVLPVFNVDSVSGGVITAVSLVTAGNIEETPDVDGGTGGLQANVSGGTGTGGVLTVTYQNVAATQEDVVVLNAPGEGGSDDIRVAIRTHQETDQSGFETVFNWQLFGLVEYNSALALHAQNNISPGIEADIGDRSSTGGAYMVLKENDADPDITFWLSVTNRRLILVCKVETASTTYYPSMYLGLLNPFSTTALEPYPLWVQGCTNRSNSYWGDSIIGRISGLSDMYAVSSFTSGPAMHRVNGTWQHFRNYTCVDTGSPNRSQDADYTLWPTGVQTYTPQTYDDTTRQASLGMDMSEIYPSSGVPGSATIRMRPTPNSGDDIRPLFPLSPVVTEDQTSPVIDIYQPVGELDNLFWLSGSDATADLTSEDVQKDGDVRYVVFQCGNQIQEFNYFAIKQE